jgi:hypothetical protein
MQIKANILWISSADIIWCHHFLTINTFYTTNSYFRLFIHRWLHDLKYYLLVLMMANILWILSADIVWCRRFLTIDIFYDTNSYIGFVHSSLITWLKILSSCANDGKYIMDFQCWHCYATTFWQLTLFMIQILASALFIHCWLHKS